MPPPPKKKSGKIFFGKLCIIRAFSDKIVKFENFVNFSGKYHKKFGYFDDFSHKNRVKFGHFVNFSYILGQKCLAPKVD